MKNLTMKTPHIVHLTSVHEPFDNRIFKECQSIAESGYKATLSRLLTVTNGRWRPD
jgi:hypothetical protein